MLWIERGRESYDMVQPRNREEVHSAPAQD